ncbi:twin-arginine translocation signal domain-containing protein [Nostoc sp. DedQUE07]
MEISRRSLLKTASASGLVAALQFRKDFCNRSLPKQNSTR